MADPRFPKTVWSETGDREGWAIFDSDYGDALQKIDEDEKFESDADAWEFVWKRAAEGSAPHVAALAHLKDANPAEYRDIAKYCTL